MKRKFKKALWAIVTVLLISNWPGFKNLTGINDWYYMYSNKSGKFTGIETPID